MRNTGFVASVLTIIMFIFWAYSEVILPDKLQEPIYIEELPFYILVIVFLILTFTSFTVVLFITSGVRSNISRAFLILTIYIVITYFNFKAIFMVNKTFGLGFLILIIISFLLFLTITSLVLILIVSSTKTSHGSLSKKIEAFLKNWNWISLQNSDTITVTLLKATNGTDILPNYISSLFNLSEHLESTDFPSPFGKYWKEMACTHKNIPRKYFKIYESPNDGGIASYTYYQQTINIVNLESIDSKLLHGINGLTEISDRQLASSVTNFMHNYRLGDFKKLKKILELPVPKQVVSVPIYADKNYMQPSHILTFESFNKIQDISILSTELRHLCSSLEVLLVN